MKQTTLNQLNVTKHIFLNIYHFPSTITDTNSFHQPKKKKLKKLNKQIQKVSQNLKNRNGTYLNLSKRNLEVL